MNRPENIEDALNLAPGISMPFHSQRDSPLFGIRDSSIYCLDRLPAGPSSPNPVVHLKLRQLFWGNIHSHETSPTDTKENLPFGAYGAKQFIKLINDYRRDRPVNLWVTQSWQDLLSLWWMMDTLLQGQFDLNNIWLVESRTDDELRSTLISGDRELHLSCHANQFIEAAFEKRMQPISLQQIESGAKFWKAFASRDLKSFLQLLETETHPIEEVEAIVKFAIGIQLPEYKPVSNYCPLKLSTVDQLILENMSVQEWRKPVYLPEKFLNNDSNEAALFEYYLFSMGDFSYLDRLKAWTTSHHQVLEQQQIEGESGYNNVEYRLTPTGAKIVQEGLTSPDLAPPLRIGGVTYYDPQQTWCKMIEGDSYSLLKLQDIL